jgi:ATP-dependent Clp protease adaptor protein ClpS
MGSEKTKSIIKNKTTKEGIRELVLFNDDFNTFDFVIETLIELCEHDAIQAEQCAFMVHFKGKCAVKSGAFRELKPIQQEMLNRSLTASIK